MLRSLILLVALIGIAALMGGDSDAAAAHGRPPRSVPSIGGCIDFNEGNCGDLDGDGYWGSLEIQTGSDPNNPNSTPEYGLLDEQFPPHRTCDDGIDNDLDGRIDRRDPGCRVTCWRFQPGPACTDRDHDGWLKYMELALGSNPNDPLSTPEGYWALPGTCSDGIDNDRDGFIDSADDGCSPPSPPSCIDFTPNPPPECSPV